MQVFCFDERMDLRNSAISCHCEAENTASLIGFIIVSQSLSSNSEQILTR